MARGARTAIAVLVVCASGNAKPILWRNPGAIEAQNLRNGPVAAPRGPFRFVKEITSGSNPKVQVRDASGRTWIAKWGNEVKAEVFASRLAWATGYYVQPSYFVRSGVIRGARKLGRARWFIAKDGRFKSASFKLIRPGPAYVAGRGWEWDDNPFIGTRQLAGLKVLMMLTSNWDAKDGRKDTNTAVLRAGSSTYYVVDDWGASMGRWGNFFTREKWDCDEYAEQSSSFVRVESGCLRFGYSGKNEDDLTAGIRITDVRWIAGLLARIEHAQLRDALRASGASPHEVRCFARAVRARIDRLRRVSRA